jgi:hypothetical protein
MRASAHILVEFFIVYVLLLYPILDFECTRFANVDCCVGFFGIDDLLRRRLDGWGPPIKTRVDIMVRLDDAGSMIRHGFVVRLLTGRDLSRAWRKE